MSGEPILVGGDHRSGTTLLSVILDSHPELVVGPELDFLLPRDLGPHLLDCCNLLAAGDERVAGGGVRTRDPELQPGVQLVRQCERFGVTPDELQQLVSDAMRSVGGDLVSFADRCVLVELVGESRRARTGARRWGIKIQREIAHAADFAAVWPDAQFVHVVRDGRDVAASQLRDGRDWGYTRIDEAAAGWLEVVESPALSAVGARLWTVRYERLVASPRDELAPLFRFIGVAWSDHVLRHAERRHTLFEYPHEHPSADSARRPIYSDAVGRYVVDLTPDEVAVFERIAGGALARLGYTV